MSSTEQSKHTSGQTMAYDSSSRSINVSNGTATLLGKNKEAMQEFGRKDEIHTGRKIVSPKQKETLISLVTSKSEEQQSTQCEFSGQNKQERKSSVFKGETFCFSHSFPEDRVCGYQRIGFPCLALVSCLKMHLRGILIDVLPNCAATRHRGMGQSRRGRGGK